jgi:hypothetical protein
MTAGQNNTRPQTTTRMPYIFYYLTEDPGNLKERNEIDYLRSIGRVVVVTRGDLPTKHFASGTKTLNLPGQPQSVVSLYSLWTKLCYLLCRPSDSLTDKGFPSRNVYTGHALLRWLINLFWPAKYIGFINRLLPTYESLYFAPFRLARLFVRDKNRSNTRFQRIVVHDSLILRLTRFTPFILTARRGGLQTVANVKSWDNPFYSQFVRGASAYLTWSQSMWSDVQRFHQVRTTAHHAWGPRPFYNFANTVRRVGGKPNSAPGTVVIGYAAAFCDTLMAAHEVMVLVGIADHLLADKADVKILFRPYPVVPMSSYEPLLRCPNIEIVDIKGPSLDRYGDGREIIRFGSDEERIQYLSCCHCFLSIGTSFTFEAAIFGLPVLQYFVPREERSTEHESVFFQRLDISDHILNYFLPYLPVAKNSTALLGLIKALETDSALQQPPLKMMAAMGFPSQHTAWDESSKRLITNLQLG